MNQKTNFSFEVQYLPSADGNPAQLNDAIDALAPALQKLLAAHDGAATVAVSDSHKGSASKIVELTTTLQDAQIAEVLQAFSAQHAVKVSALE
ncbi:MAG: hypothetical protein JWR68_2418 [Polaromonas sp.]|nr:hypothetical protein [Polaromonas sp.]